MGYRERKQYLNELKTTAAEAHEALEGLRGHLEGVMNLINQINEDVEESVETLEERFSTRAENLQEKWQVFADLDEPSDLAEVEAWLNEVEEATIELA